MLSVDTIFLVPEVFQEISEQECASKSMKTHEKDDQSGSLLAFVKQMPVKKVAVVATEQGPVRSRFQGRLRKRICHQSYHVMQIVNLQNLALLS